MTHLNLSDAGFSGLILPEISHLSNLVSLDLSKNYGAEFALHGFDSLVQNLTKLQKLHLGGISISSVFPNSLLNRSSLISLDLSSCELYGRFLDHDIHLPKLELLYLYENQDLSGNFPRFSENNSLIDLALSITNFNGELPASMGNLKSLQTLDLNYCQFSGSIPASLENLTQITFLSLQWNNFIGKIPNVFDNLRNLKSLDLSINNLSGQIPPSIGNLTNLYFIGLSNNKLTGHIGEFQFHSLEIIDLSTNELHGSIPSSIFELVNLRYLFLSSNKLSGVLETSKFEKLRNLTRLDLSNNMLSLTMSSNSNSMLPNIEIVDLSHNNISGIWTWNMGKYTLYHLNLSYNSMSGFEMQPWKMMGILDLHSNLLQGPLPTPPNSIIFFSISHNKLSGEISPLICKVSWMGVLDLSYNNLSGLIPHCLGIFSGRLFVLNLRRNQFHGTIPQIFLKDNSIRTLDFNSNQLEGLVPQSLIICRELEILDLGNNKINDTFPHWLGALPKLQVLVLRSNRFHGHIGFSKFKSPFMSLRIIDIAHNDFESDLPEMYLRSLKATMNIDEGNMTREYMGDSYYQDSTMVTIKGLEIEFVKILNTFTTIDLSSNKFQGEIPECIGNLNSLRGLNLSNNYLTGHIPLSLRNLKMLESLDLSSNNLSGRIPQELTSLTFLEVLNLSQNHLTGFIPRGNQFETFENDSYYGNPGLCGFPLSERCKTDEVLEPSQEIETEFENGFDWKITFMGYGCGLVIGFSLGCLIFLSRKPEWLVLIIDENIHKKIMKYKRSTHRRGVRRN